MDVEGACHERCEQETDTGDEEAEANEAEYTQRLSRETETLSMARLTAQRRSICITQHDEKCDCR